MDPQRRFYDYHSIRNYVLPHCFQLPSRTSPLPSRAPRRTWRPGGGFAIAFLLDDYSTAHLAPRGRPETRLFYGLYALRLPGKAASFSSHPMRRGRAVCRETAGFPVFLRTISEIRLVFSRKCGMLSAVRRKPAPCGHCRGFRCPGARRPTETGPVWALH